jgi:hypothetical protein
MWMDDLAMVFGALVIGGLIAALLYVLCAGD